METKKTRNTNVEVLRMLVMFGILLWHVTVHGYGLANIENLKTIEHGFMNSLSAAMFAPCVDIFVLISGYYGIRFSFQTLARFEGQAIFYSYMKTIGAIILFGSCEDLVGRLFPIMSGSWWFLTTYIMLFIIAPILNEGVKRLTEKQHLSIICLLIAINCVGYLFIRRIINGYNLQSFILLYVIGQYLHAYKDKYKILSNIKVLVPSAIICTLINLLVVYLCLKLGAEDSKFTTKYIMLYLSYSNPVILLQAILIICAVLSLNPTYNIKINTIAKHVFAVYLITEGISDHIYKPLKEIFNDSFLLGLLACIFVFFACLVIEAVRSKAYDFVYSKVVLLRKSLNCDV